MDTSLAARVAVGLNKLGLALRSRSWEGAGPRGLTPTQLQVLILLRNRGRGEPALADVAAGLGVTPATASEAVSTLEAKGLLAKWRSEKDRRRLALRLTDDGRDEARRAEGPPEFVHEALALLGDDDQAALLRSLTAMIRALQLRGEIDVARLCVGCVHFRPHAHADADAPHHCAFVDAAFGDRELQLDCPDHEDPGESEAARLWDRFAAEPP